MGDDFARARAALNADVGGFCRVYLPGGTVKGEWWLASCPWRVDKHPSLGVHLTSGRWKDFANPGDRGDLIDLRARIDNRPAIEIVRAILGTAR